MPQDLRTHLGLLSKRRPQAPAATLEPSSSAASLIQAAFKRGYQGTVEVVLILVGLIPAAALELNRAPGYESAPLLLAAFWLCPIALLVVWTRLDAAGQAGREIWMWFEAVVMSARRLGPDAPAISAFESASVHWETRPLVETATALRTALAPMVRGRLPNGFWIFEARFFYLLLWTAISIGVGLFVAAAAAWLPAKCASCN